MQTKNTTRQRQSSRLSPFDEPATRAECGGVPIRTYGYTHVLAGAPDLVHPTPFRSEISGLHQTARKIQR